MTTISGSLAAALAGRYRLDRELGRGGMATVYLAHDLRHDRKVAVKVLRPELAAMIGAERFLAEIRTTANLQHPHILPLFDSGLASSEPAPSTSPAREGAEHVYYVMPFVEGESLRDRLTREKQLPIADAVRLAREVASALDYAHRQGVIHRDIKPENILLHDGRAVVADFGIALAASKAGGTRLTETGLSLGTPHYMSPEQAMGERELDQRSDVYALGCVLYEMLTGEPPFTGPTAQAIVAKVMTATPEPVTTLRRTVPPAVAAAVHQALEKLPADRWPSAAAFSAALVGEGPVAPPATPKEAWKRRREWLPAAVIGWLGLVATGIAFHLGRVVGGGMAGPAVYDVALPDSAAMTFSAASVSSAYGTPLRNLSVAAGGKFVVYAGLLGDSTQLWVRSLEDASARAIPGTVGATAPRISPDETRVAYFDGIGVMVLALAGGESRHLLDVQGATGIDWLGRDSLRVLYDDGTAMATVDLNSRVVRTKALVRCPLGTWLPRARHYLCSWNNTLFTVDPASGTRGEVRFRAADGSRGSEVRGTAGLVIDRLLLFVSPDGELSAAPFDEAAGLVGRPVALQGGIRREPVGAAQFDITRDGGLVFAPGLDARIGRMVRLRRGGAPEPLPLLAAEFERFDLSPDGRWLAAVVAGALRHELRLYDLRDGQMVSWLSAEYLRHPIWAPGGGSLLISARDSTRWSILRGIPQSGRAPDTLYTTTDPQAYMDAVDYRNSGAVILQEWENASVGWAALDARLGPRTVLIDRDARFGSAAPGGRLLAYQSVDGSRVMVTTFPTAGRRWQVAGQGVEPLWLSSFELLFRVGVAWYMVRVDPLTGEPAGPPVFWARDPRFSDTSGWSHRVTSDGAIIYLQSPEESSVAYLRVIPGWLARARAAVDSVN